MGKKLGALTVSGLMIGPILGSGIVFLPSLAYSKLGEHSIIAWMIMMALGALFAYVFARMTTVVSTNQGISAIVGNMLGGRFSTLAANYLTAGVFLGPVAVALTAADLIRSAVPSVNDINNVFLAGIVLIVCALIVILKVSFMGKFMLALSSVTACLLLISSLASLVCAPAIEIPNSLPDAGKLGHTLLLIFWSIVGWEVMGNYVEDISNAKRTVMRAMKISLSAIILIYLLTSFALQNSGSGVMSNLLSPVFGRFSDAVFGIIAASLCICTIVTFTGAVARQTGARLRETQLPELFKKKGVSVLTLLAINLIVLVLNAADLLSFENIVGAANALFIGNAFLGLVSGFRLIRTLYIRIGIGILLCMLLMIFMFSPFYYIIFFALVTVVSLCVRPKQQQLQQDNV